MHEQFYQQFFATFEPYYQTIIKQLPNQFLSQTGMQSAVDSFFAPLFPLAEKGKRIRPYLIAVGSQSLSEQVLKVATAYEILHLFALVHDDIIDGATHRRGVPTAHNAYEKQGDHGVSAGILLGDYLLVVANALMYQASEALLPQFQEIQFFLCFGQYYELHHWGKTIDKTVVEQIELFKSAQYTFIYPLRLGLMLQGKSPTLLDNYGHFAGLAFQLRDDWLDSLGTAKNEKDVGIDQKNGVSNIVQLLLDKHDHDLGKVQPVVREMLTNYQERALKALQKAHLDKAQTQQLTDILLFATTVEE